MKSNLGSLKDDCCINYLRSRPFSATLMPSCIWREPNETARVALTRVGTRVIEDLSTLPGLDHVPWVSRYVQGLIDVPFLNLTPGTRNGIIHDERYAGLIDALKPLEGHVQGLIEEQQRAEEEQASQQSLKAIQKAFYEAMLALPREEYDWFDIQGRAARQEGGGTANSNSLPVGAESEEMLPGVSESRPSDSPQRQFFDFAGPLFGVVVSPAASTTPLNETRKFRALPRDRSRRRVSDDLQFAWELTEGEGSLHGVTDQEVEYRAPAVPGLARLKVTVSQHEITTTAEALITVTDSLESAMSPAVVEYARVTGVHLRACRRRTLALPLRRRAQHHRGQQRPPGFRVCNAQSGPAVALPGATLRQRARAQEFRRTTRRSTTRTHDRTLTICRRKTQIWVSNPRNNEVNLLRHNPERS